MESTSPAESDSAPGSSTGLLLLFKLRTRPDLLSARMQGNLCKGALLQGHPVCAHSSGTVKTTTGGKTRGQRGTMEELWNTNSGFSLPSHTVDAALHVCVGRRKRHNRGSLETIAAAHPKSAATWFISASLRRCEAASAGQEGQGERHQGELGLWHCLEMLSWLKPLMKSQMKQDVKLLSQSR